MIFAVILAGGIGSRMGESDTPKQFLLLHGKPIIICTLEKFIINPRFDKVLVLTPEKWIEHTKDLINRHIGINNNIVVLAGGNTRNETIMNSICYIENEYSLDDNTIVVTHDAVRPFVTHRIIEENINSMKDHIACDTVVAATDTIIESEDAKSISEIPDRRLMYQGQTPQTFKAKIWKGLYLSMSDQEKDTLTDAAKIFVLKGFDVKLVRGENYNIKITYPQDLLTAQSLLKL